MSKPFVSYFKALLGSLSHMVFFLRGFGIVSVFVCVTIPHRCPLWVSVEAAKSVFDVPSSGDIVVLYPVNNSWQQCLETRASIPVIHRAFPLFRPSNLLLQAISGIIILC